MLFALVPLALATEPTPRPPAPEQDDRELIIHGFRAPVTGIELRDGHLGFHLGVYPIILGDEGVTTWFSKMGLTAYFLRFRAGSERKSSFYVSGSLLQGLSGAHDVRVDLDEGTAFSVDVGFRWAVWRSLDLRLGASVLATAAGDVYVNPNPGISWRVALGGPK